MKIPTCEIEEIRKNILTNGLVENQDKFNQYFTPGPIGKFMASLFTKFSSKVKLLDPGFGIGILSAAVVDEVVRRNLYKSENQLTQNLDIVGHEIDQSLEKYVDGSLNLMKSTCDNNDIDFHSEVYFTDFIKSSSSIITDNLFTQEKNITHVIMNPPYGKINKTNEYYNLFSSCGLEIVNLYTAFIVLGIRYLQKNGEIVAIIPRSFCNGPYYESFRAFLLDNISLKHVHIFDKRDETFKENNVLQETIIFHGIKKKEKTNIIISSSRNGDFYYSKSHRNSNGNNSWVGDFGQITSPSLTMRKVKYNDVIHDDDPQKILHISPTELDQMIVDRIGCFNTSYEDLGIKVSTGPVVDFRLRQHLLDNFIEFKSAPLLFPVHVRKTLEWPIRSNKPNAIKINGFTEKLLWEKNGFYVTVHRFSSKEERRRIKASVVDTTQLPGKKISFDNKLNVFHQDKNGFDKNLAKGLFIYLNSSLVDDYYRQFGGHTQVNVNDLKSIMYPSVNILVQMGKKFVSLNISQKEIDAILDSEINNMSPKMKITPKDIQNKKDEALQVLIEMGMPKAQLNERTALTLLALLNLTPDKSWQDIEAPLMGITPIMDWVRIHYKENYAPNTRETFRRQSMHQFEQAGIVEANPDEPGRAINSPFYCYQVTSELIGLLRTYNTKQWETELKNFLEDHETLREKYSKRREIKKIPIELPKTKLFLSSGNHSELIKKIIDLLQPIFAENSTLIYVGDTGGKEIYFDIAKFDEIGISLDRHGKMPDVILIDDEKKWLFLIEAVTSHGPVDPKRYIELSELFMNKDYGLIFITSFEDRQTFGRYVTEISWETEVWIADSPSHLIHFDGERFLGPYTT